MQWCALFCCLLLSPLPLCPPRRLSDDLGLGQASSPPGSLFHGRPAPKASFTLAGPCPPIPCDFLPVVIFQSHQTEGPGQLQGLQCPGVLHPFLCATGTGRTVVGLNENQNVHVPPLGQWMNKMQHVHTTGWHTAVGRTEDGHTATAQTLKTPRGEKPDSRNVLAPWPELPGTLEDATVEWRDPGFIPPPTCRGGQAARSSPASGPRHWTVHTET